MYKTGINNKGRSIGRLLPPAVPAANIAKLIATLILCFLRPLNQRTFRHRAPGICRPPGKFVSGNGPGRWGSDSASDSGRRAGYRALKTRLRACPLPCLCPTTVCFLFDMASQGKSASGRLRLSMRSDRTNPKREPSKIRYAEPLACQGLKRGLTPLSGPLHHPDWRLISGPSPYKSFSGRLLLLYDACGFLNKATKCATCASFVTAHLSP